jgi:hypothetical protein
MSSVAPLKAGQVTPVWHLASYSVALKVEVGGGGAGGAGMREQPHEPTSSHWLYFLFYTPAYILQINPNNTHTFIYRIRFSPESALFTSDHNAMRNSEFPVKLLWSAFLWSTRVCSKIDVTRKKILL